VLHFVLTKNSGSSKPGTPYHMKYTGTLSNSCTQNVDHPQVVFNFFANSNTINAHTQLCQDNLRLLEKKWMTQNPWFHLAMTPIGITVSDAFLLCNHHNMMNCRVAENQGGTHDSAFSGILALQLIEMTKKLESTSSDKFLPEVRHQAYVNLSEREYGCKALRL
jgi:hypothetical protein